MNYAVIFIEIYGPNISKEIMEDFEKDGHCVKKFASVEESSNHIKESNYDSEIVLIWHLSSSFYQNIELTTKRISDATKLFEDCKIDYKYGVSDTEGFRDEALRTGWFKCKNVDLVFSWNGLAEHFVE